MDDIVDMGELQYLIKSVQNWLATEVLVPSTLFQVIWLLVLLGIAWWLGPRLKNGYEALAGSRSFIPFSNQAGRAGTGSPCRLAG